MTQDEEALDEEALHEEAAVLVAGSESGGGPSDGLLSFYDRLRERIVRYVDQRGGRLGSRTVEVLLLIPDVFMLLARLGLDKDVPQSTRMLIGGALAYFMLPADFLPEMFVGPTGFIDDLILALVVLAHSFGDEIEPYAEKYWSGSTSFRTTLRDLLATTDALINSNVYERLREFLAQKGIDLDEVTSRYADRPGPEPAES